MADHRAAAFLNPGNYIVSVAEDGAILKGEHWFGPDRTERLPPPKDFFADATAFATVSDYYISARPGLPVRSFNVTTGAVVSFPETIQNIVEMDSNGTEIILRDAVGRVFVVTAEGTPSSLPYATVPADIGPAIAVRIGIHMYAAQRLDGTWRAWGESNQLVIQTAKIGHAIDIDFYSEGPGTNRPAYMMWIEPVADGAEGERSNAAKVTWQRVERSEAEWKADGFAVNGDWIDFGTQDGKSRQWAMSSAANEQPEQLRDVAVRVRYHWVDQREPNSNIRLSARTRGNNVVASAGLWQRQLRLAFPPQYPERSLPKAMETGQEGTLEMAVIKNRLIVRLNGMVMLDESDPRLAPFGDITISSSHCWLRDFEYLKLDGINDPLKALGWAVPAEIAVSTNSLWQKAVWPDKELPNVSADGWFSVGDKHKSATPHSVSGQVKTPVTFGDGAVRAQLGFGTFPSGGISFWLRMPYEQSIQFVISKSELRATRNGDKGAEMGLIAFDTPFQPGEVERFEAAAVGDTFIARFKGKELRFQCPEANRSGSIMFYGRFYEVKDVEYAILDGIADPLKALGWEVLKDTADKTAASLSPWKKAVLSNTQLPYVSADGWFSVGNELRQIDPQTSDKKVEFRDGAVRAQVRFTATRSSAMSFWLRQPMDQSVSFAISELELVARRNEGGTKAVERGRIVFDTPFRSGDVERFEAAAVGDTFVVRFKGKELRFQDAQAVKRSGPVTFHGRNYGVKHIEYAILDGLPDPLTALGWEVAEGAEASQQAGWRDFLAELIDGPHKNGQLGRVWKQENGSWRVGQSHAFRLPDETGRDLAARILGTMAPGKGPADTPGNLAVHLRQQPEKIGYTAILFNTGTAYIRLGAKDLKTFTLGADFDPAAKHSLELRAQGDQLTLLVDDVELGSVRDATLPAGGSFGVGASEGSWVEKVEYQFLNNAPPKTGSTVPSPESVPRVMSQTDTTPSAVLRQQSSTL